MDINSKQLLICEVITMRGKMIKIFKNEQGYTLIIAVSIILIISILGVSLMKVTSTTLKQSDNERNYQSVYYIAESGVSQVRAKINEIANNAFNKTKIDYDSLKVEEKATYPFEEKFLQSTMKAVNSYIEANKNTNNYPIKKIYSTQIQNNLTPFSLTEIEPLNNVVTSNSKLNSLQYSINSTGKIGDKTTRKVSQTIKITLNANTEGKEETSNDEQPSTFKACSNGDFNSINSTGSLDIEGDVILKEGGKLSANGNIKGNFYSFGSLEINNSINFGGNIYASQSIKIPNRPTISGQLYSKGDITINNNPPINGDIVSENNVYITNGGMSGTVYAAQKIVSSSTSIKKFENVTINNLPKPKNLLSLMNDPTKIYEGQTCTNMDSDQFKPKIPSVDFQITTSDFPSSNGGSTLTFSDSQKNLYFNKFGVQKPIEIKLPNRSKNEVYSIYVDTLNMDNQDISISGNGILKVYVKSSLGLGSINQLNSSDGKPRSNFDTTIYYLSDKPETPYFSNWGGKKINANIFIKNSDLNTNQCKINGNIIVLGKHSVTISGDNETNGQIFYLPESNLSASGSATITGYVKAKNVTGSGNIKIFNPTSDINTDIFDTPNSSKNYTYIDYKSANNLVTEVDQKEVELKK